MSMDSLAAQLAPGGTSGLGARRMRLCCQVGGRGSRHERLPACSSSLSAVSAAVGSSAAWWCMAHLETALGRVPAAAAVAAWRLVTCQPDPAGAAARVRTWPWAWWAWPQTRPLPWLRACWAPCLQPCPAPWLQACWHPSCQLAAWLLALPPCSQGGPWQRSSWQPARRGPGEHAHAVQPRRCLQVQPAPEPWASLQA